ncbi:hypothetical protein PFISCL1PPCAC_825, partial [Pristionchus fissidentatus]
TTTEIITLETKITTNPVTIVKTIPIIAVPTTPSTIIITTTPTTTVTETSTTTVSTTPVTTVITTPTTIITTTPTSALTETSEATVFTSPTTDFFTTPTEPTITNPASTETTTPTTFVTTTTLPPTTTTPNVLQNFTMVSVPNSTVPCYYEIRSLGRFSTNGLCPMAGSDPCAVSGLISVFGNCVGRKALNIVDPSTCASTLQYTNTQCVPWEAMIEDKVNPTADGTAVTNEYVSSLYFFLIKMNIFI